MGVLLSCHLCCRCRRCCHIVSRRSAACRPAAACRTSFCAAGRGGYQGCRLQHGACSIGPQVHGVGQRLIGSCCRRLGSCSRRHSCTHFLRRGHLLPPAVAIGPRLNPAEGATSAGALCTTMGHTLLSKICQSAPTGPLLPYSLPPSLPTTPRSAPPSPIPPPVVLPHGDQLGTDSGHEAAVGQRDALAQGHGGGCLPQVLPRGLQVRSIQA